MDPSLSRRGFVKQIGGALAATGALRGKASSQSPTKKPNILYLHSHDSGRYLAPYGHSVPTPRLLRLARTGATFRQMHSASPGCSPSRAAMLTGQTSHQSGMLGLAHRGWSLTHPDRHIIHTLKPHGYQTVLAGLQHVAANPKNIGYDQLLPHATDSAKDVAPAAVSFLHSRAAKQQPFFLDVGFFETHRLYPDPVDNPDYLQPPAPLPDTPETRRDMAGYFASARVLDTAVGQVLDALEEAGLAENTLVISTTDHGIAFPNMKCTLRDTGTGVSMILRGPGAFSQPQVCDALLSQIDLFPTLCDYLGIEKPTWLTGQSFLPLVEGKQQSADEAVFAEINFHAAYEPSRSVRTARYKYIRRFDHRSTAVLVNCDDGASKSYWLKNGWQQQPLLADNEGEELYDLLFDPAERTNLATHSNAQGTLHEMRQRLSQWMTKTEDPLLQGPLPVPAGVRTDDPSSISGTTPQSRSSAEGKH